MATIEIPEKYIEETLKDSLKEESDKIINELVVEYQKRMDEVRAKVVMGFAAKIMEHYDTMKKEVIIQIPIR